MEEGDVQVLRLKAKKIELGDGQRGVTGWSENLRLITAEKIKMFTLCSSPSLKRTVKIIAPQVLTEVRGKSREDHDGGTVQEWSSFSHQPPKLFEKNQIKNTTTRSQKLAEVEETSV